MTPRMRMMIEAFKRADPDYVPPKEPKATNSNYAYWINGMSEQMFKLYVEEEINFSLRMQAKKRRMHEKFLRDLGKPKRIDVGKGIAEVVQ